MTCKTCDDRFFSAEWPVFYGDNHLLVLYKPALLAVQRGTGHDVSLIDLAKKWIGLRYRKPGRVFLGLVHRLDFPVAGVMVFARTSKAAARLSAQFREGAVQKTYLAVVEGIPRSREGILRQLLVKGEKRSRIAGTADDGGREAVLDYRVMDTFRGRALLEVNLRTGRKHQIRSQLSHMGCPVAGDGRYGAQFRFPAGQIALMSKSLVFSHPTKIHRVRFDCPAPRGWPWPEPVDTGGKKGLPWTWHQIRTGLDRNADFEHFSFDN